jgi:hypothetical protein
MFREYFKLYFELFLFKAKFARNWLIEYSSSGSNALMCELVMVTYFYANVAE